MASALRDQGRDVATHDDLFPPDAKDEAWLRWAGENGRIVLTRDDRIRYRENERAALIEAGVYAFILVAKNIDGLGMARAFVAALPRIERLVSRNKAPLLARVSASGTVELIGRRGTSTTSG